MPLYAEPVEAGALHRAEILRELQAFVAGCQGEAARVRRAYFQPDCSSPEAYSASTAAYRQDFKAMLGWPLVGVVSPGSLSVREEPVAEDDLGRILRLWIETLPGLHTYGVLFLPHAPGRHPLVISQHGGLGSPELCSGFYGDSNYNHMTRRVLERGCAVFAPQLFLWGEDYGPKIDRAGLDAQLKQVGGSITALEIYQLQRCLDVLSARPEVDPDRIGMIGLSYGGFYTLFTAAVETRIRASVSSCFFNDRTRYAWADWTWRDSALRFLDAEVAGLVCPRALYIEVADQDELFDPAPARQEAVRAASFYQRLGFGERFCFHEFSGVHELDKGDGGIRFLMQKLEGS
jgi:hypothetical protein